MTKALFINHYNDWQFNYLNINVSKNRIFVSYNNENKISDGKRNRNEGYRGKVIIVTKNIFQGTTKTKNTESKLIAIII